MKTFKKHETLVIYKKLFSRLINLCVPYLPNEDIDKIASVNVKPPMNILKQKSWIQINQKDCISMMNVLCTNSFVFDKIEKLDYLFAIDIVNKFENVAPFIKMVGASIKSGGIFAFTYERTNRGIETKEVSDSPQRLQEDSMSFPVIDGVIQQHLIDNEFYIQHENEFQLCPKQELNIVLIVAQKK